MSLTSLLGVVDGFVYQVSFERAFILNGRAKRISFSLDATSQRESGWLSGGFKVTNKIIVRWKIVLTFEFEILYAIEFVVFEIGRW